MYREMLACGTRPVTPPIYVCENKDDERDVTRVRITDIMFLWDDNEKVDKGAGVMNFRDYVRTCCFPSYYHLMQFLVDCGELEE